MFIFLTNFFTALPEKLVVNILFVVNIYFLYVSVNVIAHVWQLEENFPESVPANFVEAFCFCYSACSRLAGCELPASCAFYTHFTV